MRSSIADGRGAGIAAAWAHAAGVAIYALATVVGISALLAAAPALLLAIKMAGAIYLLFLAWHLLHSRGSDLGAENSQRSSALAAARDGFAIAFLNPKLALFMLALFSQFLKPDYAFPEYTVMVATVTLIDGGWYTLVAVLLTGGTLLRHLQSRAAMLDRGFGLMIALLALLILYQSLKELIQH